MKRAHLLTLAAVLLIGGTARASDPIGVYALLDKVVLEPNDTAPKRVQLWGTFALARRGGNEHTPPARGYMYFALVNSKEDACRREWADLKKVAGTGQVVAFGNSRAPTGSVRKPGHKTGPAAPLDVARLEQLIADLSNDEFTVREKAMHELERQGEHAYPALRKALEGKLSAEARKRVQRLLETETPDPYPLGFGLVRLEGDFGRFWKAQLESLPEPVSPAEGAKVQPGPVTLCTRNIPQSAHQGASYVFEIVDASGTQEASPVVAAGDKVTEWTPQMKVKADQKYTWRVRAVEGKWTGPTASVAFQGKAAR
jgi:hypothetical protein